MKTKKEETAQQTEEVQEELCCVCNRPFGGKMEDHHVIPKTFKGKETVTIHSICHRKIHTVFTERELFLLYNTMERVVNHLEIQKFVKWVSNKPPEYYSKTKDTNEKKKRISNK